MHRGHGRVARRLVGLELDGDEVPEPGSALTVEQREAGHITSSTRSPALGKPIALAYLQRDYAEPGTAVFSGLARAVVVPLPFRYQAASQA